MLLLACIFCVPNSFLHLKLTPLKPDIFCRSLLYCLQSSGVFCLEQLLCTDKAMLLVFIPCNFFIRLSIFHFWTTLVAKGTSSPLMELFWVWFFFVCSGLHKNCFVPVLSLLRFTTSHLFLLSPAPSFCYLDIYSHAQINSSKS